MLIPLTLLLLAAEPAKATEAPKPRTAPLSEASRLKLQNNALRFELLKRDITAIQQENEHDHAETCKAAGFAKCQVDPEKKLVVEVKE